MNDRHQYALLKTYWEGSICRQDLIDRFSIVPSQATKDFAYIKDNFDGAIEYDSKLKRYVPGQKLFAHLGGQSFSDYVESVLRKSDVVYEVAPVGSGIPVDTYRKIYLALSKKIGVEFGYFSLNHADLPKRRVIFPHSLINSGFRWHIRGWEQETDKFKDFNLSRITGEINLIDKHEKCSAQIHDFAWSTEVDVLIVPNPTLSLDQRKVVGMDFHLTNGVLRFKCRGALLMYVLHSYLITDFSKSPPKNQLLAVDNLDDLAKFLPHQHNA